MMQRRTGKRFLSVLLTGGLLFGMLPAAAFADGEQGISFNDVKEADWFYDSVQYVCENEMMSGTGDTVFSPDAATTRGMLVTILYRMEGSPAVDGDMKFTDVSADRYYAAAAAWASENNIVNGYGNGVFGAENPVTREQMAAILYRYAQLKICDIAATGNLAGFSDLGDVSAYAANPLKWAVGNGLISGMENGVLAPGESATRAQTASILMRFCETIIPSGPENPAMPSGSVTYENQDLGFVMEFPDTWENRYSVEPNPENPSGIVVCTEWGGILCFVDKDNAEEWAESAKNDMIPVEYRVLGESGEYVYVMYFPSDVNYQGEEQAEVYQEMHQDLYYVGFKIL